MQIRGPGVAVRRCAGFSCAKYGQRLRVIDDGINWTSNASGKTQFNITRGVVQANRWGLRGTWNLGGRLSAVFVLENGFDPNTGGLGQKNAGSTQGLMFGRQAYAGLSNSWGTVTLGRQYDSVVDYVDMFQAGSQWGG